MKEMPSPRAMLPVAKVSLSENVKRRTFPMFGLFHSSGESKLRRLEA